MQRPKDQVAGLGGFEGNINGFAIAHFTDQQDVGIFPQTGLERVRKLTGVNTDLSLAHQRFLAVMHKFNRIFNRDNVLGVIFVDVINHCSQRR